MNLRQVSRLGEEIPRPNAETQERFAAQVTQMEQRHRAGVFAKHTQPEFRKGRVLAAAARRVNFSR